MVHIYTFCDKTLVGKSENASAKFLCENLYKMNMRIDEVCTYCNSYDYESINFKNNDLYFLLMQKSNATLNSYLANISASDLCENQLLKETITNYYKVLNIPQDSSVILEWTIPESAVAITNPSSKTQGYFIKIGECKIFVLPNNFDELKKIYFDCLLEHIESNFNIEYKSETFKTFGLSEELIKSVLKDKLKNKDKVYISIFGNGLDNDIVIKAKKDNEMFNEYRQEVFNILEKYIYSVQDLSLSEHLTKSIISHKSKIALLGDESLIKAISKINYKILRENIEFCEIIPKEKLIEQQNKQISPELAYDIAVSGLKKSNAEIIVSSLVDIKNNMATTYIAIGNINKIDIYKNTFYGNEDDIYSNIANSVLFYLNKKIMTFEYKTV